MKKHVRFFFLFSGLLLSVITANAQTFQWVKSQQINYALNPQSIRFTIATDAAGNVLQAGMLNYKSNTSHGLSGDAMLLKYNRAGNLLFSQTITGHTAIKRVVACPNGDFLISGGFKDSVRFSPAHKLTGNANSQYYIARYNAAGQVLWVRNVSATVPGTGEVADLLEDPASRLYVGFAGTGQHSYIKKFDANGTELLSIQQTNVSRLSSISIDAAGNIFAAGSCVNNGALFGGQNFGSGFTYDVYLAKYSPAGTARWVKMVGDITCTNPEIKTGPNGSVYMAAPLYGSFAFGPFTSQGKSLVYDFFLTKLDSTGTFLWLREVPQVTNADAGPGYSSCLDVDAAGNAYLTGFQRNTLNWGNGIQNACAGNADLLIQQYSAAGALNWSKTAGGSLIDESHAVAVNSFGEVFMSGVSRGSITLDALSHNPGFSNSYPILTKLTASPAGVPANTAVIKHLEIYPNPAAEQAAILLPVAFKKGSAEIKIYDQTGKVVLRQAVVPSADNMNLNLKTLSAGLYLVVLQHENNLYRQKLVIE